MLFLVTTVADCNMQIRIVKDTISGKGKKPHRGYAFIVYEREKDMKGTITAGFISLTFPQYSRGKESRC